MPLTAAMAPLMIELPPASSPHRHAGASVRVIMLKVVATLVPGIVVYAVLFGPAILIQCLLAGASKYASQGKAKEFKVALESAIKWCTPQSLKAIPEFNPGSVIRHRFEMVLPELRQTLTLLADLAGAGLYPVSAEALRNCVRLQYEYNMSLVYALLKPSGFDAFQRACSGQEMVWA